MSPTLHPAFCAQIQRQIAGLERWRGDRVPVVRFANGLTTEVVPVEFSGRVLRYGTCTRLQVGKRYACDVGRGCAWKEGAWGWRGWAAGGHDKGGARGCSGEGWMGVHTAAGGETLYGVGRGCALGRSDQGMAGVRNTGQ